MLVLSRLEGEEILFPEQDIVIRVLKIRGKSISLGIDAPGKFRVARGELERHGPIAQESRHSVPGLVGNAG